MMPNVLQLPDGTEFLYEQGPSGRIVVFDFEESDLEKLLRLPANQFVSINGQEMTYEDARKQMGRIAAYLPKRSDYSLVAGRL